MKQVHIKHLNRNVVLVPREQMRRKSHGRFLSIPHHLKAIASAIPTPPASWDGSKSRSIKYPILGNDQFGDCYYADMCHCVQTWTGNSGNAKNEVQFNETAVIARYKVLSGGDNGLGDDQVFPEWKSGIVGPVGPHKILDDMTVNTYDDSLIRLGMWLFCGASYTAALLTGWITDPRPGQVWDAGMGQPDQNAGHAMHLSGYTSQYYADETWGFDPPINLTPAGLHASDPEVTVQFSLEMFNPTTGIAPHNGMSYDQLATLWVQLGGQTLPPNPFVVIPPPPPPIPIPPNPIPDLQTKIDAIFAALILQYRRRPSIVAMLHTVQGLIDHYLDQHPQASTAQAGDLRNIIDAIFVAIELGIHRPYITTILEIVRGLVDHYLDQHPTG